MDQPVVVTAVFHARAGAEEQLAQALTAALPAVHAEEGCELYALHRASPDVLVLIEKWTTEDLLDAHGAGEPVASLGAAIRDLVREPPTVTRLTPLVVGDRAQAAL